MRRHQVPQRAYTYLQSCVLFEVPPDDTTCHKAPHVWVDESFSHDQSMCFGQSCVNGGCVCKERKCPFETCGSNRI